MSNATLVFFFKRVVNDATRSAGEMQLCAWELLPLGKTAQGHLRGSTAWAGYPLGELHQ